ncbi:MAG TPA: acetamidase/formamidase family protein [Casimicrobiaceae bacterium]|nr:acetamidase/formamidase family protein [Casimicrobiaceae bacterium]
MSKSIRIDRTKRLAEDPGTGHNRWHPDIPPLLEVAPGEEVEIETRDSSDGQIRPGVTASDLLRMDPKVVHPLTGPIHVKGARPGDLLEIEYLEIEPQRHGWTRFLPGFGFLHDLFTQPFLVHWDLEGGWATSSALPGVRIPSGMFMGTAGVAPSHAQVAEWTRREAELRERGATVFLPDPASAVPAREPVASHGLRTIPPRENGGNGDIKQVTKGSRLLIPVNVDGALYSVGDGHFAQGDSECCGTAIEMGATVIVRFRVHEAEARRNGIRWPRFAHPDYFASPEWAVPRNFIATTGMPIRGDGTNEAGDITLATRNAVINMIDLLQERGWTREQAYVICSVAVDLKVSNVVDVPNVVVSAVLPEAIFR